MPVYNFTVQEKIFVHYDLIDEGTHSTIIDADLYDELGHLLSEPK